MVENLIKNQYPGAAAGPPGPPGPPGPAITGDPNAILYCDAAGNPITDADLTTIPIDQYGRPQIRDIRVDSGNGAVWRQGAWQADGDAENITGEGIVIYAPEDATYGYFARIKGNRLAIRRICATMDDYAFRVDGTELYLRADDGTQTFKVDRATGATWINGACIRAGDVDPTSLITGNIGDLWINKSAGLGSPVLYVKESLNGSAFGWVAK